MGAQVRLDALKLAVSMRGVTDKAGVLSVAADFETFINEGKVAFKQDVVRDDAPSTSNRRSRKGKK
tara:strand:+ start:2093 stop:2290 length:198 start_codon:yes stop_codon:yes gene_type:complete